jgi:hypothetical protein
VTASGQADEEFVVVRVGEGAAVLEENARHVPGELGLNRYGTLPGVLAAEVPASAVKKICHGGSRHWLVMGLTFLGVPKKSKGARQTRDAVPAGRAGHGPVAVSTTRGIQLYNQVTEGKERDAIRIAWARK